MEDGAATRERSPELPFMLRAQYHSDTAAREALELALMRKGGAVSDKVVMTIVGVLAGIVTVLVCWHWEVRLLGGQYGLNGGWGFEIFIAAFAVMYVPIALVRRARQRRQAKKTDDDGSPS